MRRFLRWLFLSIFATLLLAIIAGVLGEFFIEVARERGWYDKPSATLGTMVMVLSSLVSSTWFLVGTGFWGGLTAGMWLDTIMRRAEPSPVVLASTLTYQARKLSEFVTKAGNRPVDYAPPGMESEVESVMLRLRQFGIIDPRGNTTDVVLRAAMAAHFFQTIEPFLAHNQIKEARRYAKTAKREGRYSAPTRESPVPPSHRSTATERQP